MFFSSLVVKCHGALLWLWRSSLCQVDGLFSPALGVGVVFRGACIIFAFWSSNIVLGLSLLRFLQATSSCEHSFFIHFCCPSFTLHMNRHCLTSCLIIKRNEPVRLTHNQEHWLTKLVRDGACVTELRLWLWLAWWCAGRNHADQES